MERFPEYGQHQTRHYYGYNFQKLDGYGRNKHTEVVPGYENYEIKGDISKSTWQKVVETLPAT
mgnify:CR=1 FL=1